MFFFLFAAVSFSQNHKADSLLTILKTAKEDTEKVNIYNNLHRELFRESPDKSLVFAQNALALSEKLNYKTGEAIALRNIGASYGFKGEYLKALPYFQHSLEKAESIKDTSAIAGALHGFANIYYYQKNYKKSIEYNYKTLEIRTRMNDKKGMAASHIGIGNSIGISDSVYAHYYLAYKLSKSINDLPALVLALNNLSNACGQLHKMDEKEKYRFEALRIAEETGDKAGQSLMYSNIGSDYLEKGNREKALTFLEKGLKISNEIGDAEFEVQTAFNLSALYEEMKQLDKSLFYYKMAASLRDSMLNAGNLKEINEMSSKYESEKKDKEILQKESEIKEQLAENKQSALERNSFLAGFVLMIALAFFVFRGYRQKQKTNILISKQKSEVEMQKKIVEEKNKEITDSINYANRIQGALLASEELLKKNLNEHFVLFNPKDIVSGDFYWARNIENKFFLCLADCTGHGVPGAFMSLLNISLLKEAVVEKKIYQPDVILNEVRNEIISVLNPEGSQESKDGMDCVLCCFENEQLKFSCANNCLWIIRKNQLIEFKADKMPVGKFIENRPFTLHTEILQKGDCIYLSSDGYPDQFGGPKGKKFKYKQLENLLLSIHRKPMEEQKVILNNTMNQWRNNMEQVDDICIVGVRIG